MSVFRETGFGALEGLKVLDLTQALAGPYCTQLLADHGADVLKVEALHGDGSRLMGPWRDDDDQRTHGGYFQSINRNKRSIAINLKSEEGVAVLKKLAGEADVLVENFRTGVMDRLGLSYDTLKEINPRLVYAAIRGFGDPRTGPSPYQAWPAFDVVAQAMGGLITSTGPDPETPTKVGPGVGDIFPATMTAFAIMSAVFRAKNTGEGQFVDVGMVDAIFSLCERNVYQYSYRDLVVKPSGNHHPLICPFGMFPAKDGWVSIACPQDHFWRSLCEKLEMKEAEADERFASMPGRVEHREDCERIISDHTIRFTKSELTERLGGQLPFGPVMDMGDQVADAHFHGRELLVDVDQPGSQKPAQLAGIAAKMAGTPGRVVHRAPYIGEHTTEVLSELGMDRSEIDSWLEQGHIKQFDKTEIKG